MNTSTDMGLNEKVQLSIHPRYWPKFGNGIKVNTCKPRNLKRVNKKGEPSVRRGKLSKRMKRLAARRLEHSMTLKSLPANVNTACYKTPGSMKK